MKIKMLLIITFFCISCNSSSSKKTDFDNSVCLEFVAQSGYPQEICDCVKDNVENILNINKVTYENIEQMVGDCIQSNLGLGF